MNQNNIKWPSIFLLILAGVWLLASVEGVYYIMKMKNKNDSISISHQIKPLLYDSTKVIDQLKYYVNELATNDSMQHGSFGFCLVTADSGKILLEQNSDISLVPASALKIVTTGLALKLAGTGFSFRTTLQYSGTINPSTRTLNGNIYIRGSGDPTLGSVEYGTNTYSTILKRWFTSIHALGIDSINGAIIADDEIFDYDLVPGGWAWEDVEMSYGAPPSGLSFRDNLYDIQVRITKNTIQAKVEPYIPGLLTKNSIIYNPKIYNSYVFAAGPPFISERLLRGEIKYAGTYKAPMPDPAYFCAYSLYSYLKNKGINVSDSANTIRKTKIKNTYSNPERKTISTTYSTSLSEIVYRTNHLSQNMYAETLLKLIAVMKKTAGTTIAGVKEINNYWKDRNIDLRGFHMVDGSGLSRANSVTAKQLTHFLVAFHNDSAIFSSFYRSLPIYGTYVNGAKPRTISALNIHAKGGYMSRVRSLTGYAYNKNGKLLAFTIIINNSEFKGFTLMERIDRILTLISKLE